MKIDDAAALRYSNCGQMTGDQFEIDTKRFIFLTPSVASVGI